MKILISAYNVHRGGGFVLLKDILTCIPDHYFVHALVDSRAKTDEIKNPNIKISKVKASIWGRIHAEYNIKKISQDFDHLLCFGNLPPLFTPKTKVSIYIQNKYLISRNFVCWKDLRTIFRTIVEKTFFELRKSKKFTYLVQTNTMRNQFLKNQGEKFNLEIFGFSPTLSFLEIKKKKIREIDFVYVASSEPHKNHKRLITAWKILSKKNITPKLALVIDKVGPLPNWIRKECKQFNLNIEIFSELNRQEILDLYASSKALIFPSTMESFGLPLIEATQCQLPIIASELGFVYDVSDPVESFNPLSAHSIANAVDNFINSENNKEKILPLKTKSTMDFINFIGNQERTSSL